MNTLKRVLVTGATGQQGGAVARALLKRNHKVRALTRNDTSQAAVKLSKLGAELIVGDFNDHESLVQAAQNVDAVFAMSTPFESGTETETTQGIALVKAIKAAGASHIVFSSVASADKATGIPHFDSKYEVEKYLLSSGLPCTVIAPVFFMDNLVSPWYLPGLREGKLSSAMPGTRALQQIAVADIASFAAAVIERGDALHGHRYDIAGDSLNGDEAAAILSKASGRDIRYVGFPPDVLRAQSEDFALMYEWFDSTGYSADMESLKSDFPDVPWHDFESWALEQDWKILD